MNNEKKNPLLPMIVICRFERSCGTFKGGGVGEGSSVVNDIQSVCLKFFKNLI
jgi:hypothetical protein